MGLGKDRPLLSIMDCNNFWSPSGGGVRRYHLEKIAYFRTRSDVHYVFVMPDDHRRTETLDDTTVIEHVPGLKFPGNWEYRFILDTSVLGEVIAKHGPQVIEIGSPYIMPWKVRRALASIRKDSRTVGFWHADFPVTYAGRFFGKFGRLPGSIAESMAWWYARLHYNRMDSVFVASRQIMDRMALRGMQNLRYVPLGVDIATFHPDRRDESLVAELKAGMPERLTIFFGHRFCEEKGLRTFLQAYPSLCRRLGHEPAVVFAGTGPDLELVRRAAGEHAHIRYAGFIREPLEMAKWYASCELGLTLSGWETFGLSLLEALACGQMMVGADLGAAREHVEASGAGVTFRTGRWESLADAIESLYRSGNKAGLGAKGREYAEGLSWSACFERELEIYRELAGRTKV